MSIELNTALTTKRIEPKMNYHKANIKNINAEVQAFQTATEDAPINQHTITNFTESLALAIIKNTPTTTHNFFSHRLPPHIIRLIKTKRRMYREYRDIPIPDLKPPSETNVPFKILRTGTVCRYFLRICVCQGQYSVGTAGWCTLN